MNKILKKIVQNIWGFREKFTFLNFPLPCFLSHGIIYLAYGDGMGLMLFFKRPYEENEREFVYKFLKNGMTFFDVGANQGIYTLLAGKQVGTNGRVFSFEPVPSQLKKLKRNLKINRIYNTITESLAVGAENGKANMYVCLDGDEALSSLRKPTEDVKSKKSVIQVPVITIDEYVKKNKISNIDFVKIDVEGGELNVLKGMVETLKTIRPIFMCEVQDKRTAQWGYSASEICDFLESRDYSWFIANLYGELEPAELKNKHEVRGENLFAVPREKIEVINSLLIKK